MKLHKALENISGLRFLIEDLELMSATGRKMLYDLPFLYHTEAIEKAYEQTEEIYRLFLDDSSRKTLSLIEMKLMQVKDIYGTIKYIATNNVKDDIELFEIKHFAILSEAIRAYATDLNLQSVILPNLNPLIDVLDPEGKRIPTFYIYNAYSSALSEMRKAYQHTKALGDEDAAEALRFKTSQIEDKIRQDLSKKIRPYANDLKKALDGVSKIDLLLAKAKQIQQYGFCKPQISNQTTCLKALFNPQIAYHLNKENKAFQPVDIEILQGATLIVGSNMAGKSVLLKTVALVQYLAQFGFYVPCQQARICPVEVVYISLGDGQNEMKGLSSFGAEMLQLNQIIEAIEQGKTILVLLDELARTTNPREGKAIVSSMANLLQEHRVLSLITTHYSGIEVACNRLRVKGFREDKVKGKLDAININDYMDYSLQKDLSDEVPQEAIRIAEMLGVSSKLISSAKHYL